MKNLNRKLSFGVALAMTSAILSCVPSVSASASSVYGDANGDGTVDIGDAIYINKYLCGAVSALQINMKYADADKNAVIDANDTQTILSYIVGSIDSLPYSESGYTVSTNNYSVPADKTVSYVKYDCESKKQTTYTLNKLSAVSTYSGDVDDRFLDSSDNAQAIVRLSYGGGACGSGFIVDSHTIATAAHCLYGSEFASFDIQIYDAKGTSVVQKIKPKEIHIPLEFQTSKYDYDDYGLIYVDEDLSKYGKMTLGTVTEGFAGTGQNISISGFPGTVKGSSAHGQRYVGNGKENGFNRNSEGNSMITTRAYISGGDSGGPMYIEHTLKGQTFRSVVGICTYVGNDGTRYSGGVRITTPILRFYRDNDYIG